MNVLNHNNGILSKTRLRVVTNLGMIVLASAITSNWLVVTMSVVVMIVIVLIEQ